MKNTYWNVRNTLGTRIVQFGLRVALGPNDGRKIVIRKENADDVQLDVEPQQQPSGAPEMLSWATVSAADLPPRHDGDTCRCWTCLSKQPGQHGLPITAHVMVLCPRCGNKRCPHANHHDNTCTGSNEPGQQGSRYPLFSPGPDMTGPDTQSPHGDMISTLDRAHRMSSSHPSLDTTYSRARDALIEATSERDQLLQSLTESQMFAAELSTQVAAVAEFLDGWEADCVEALESIDAVADVKNHRNYPWIRALKEALDDPTQVVAKRDAEMSAKALQSAADNLPLRRPGQPNELVAQWLHERARLIKEAKRNR